MILNSDSSKTTVVGDFQATQMSIEMNAQLFKILSSSLYECKEVAVVQELVANSLDACVIAGNKEPIQISTPNSFSPELVITDYGCGMDEDTLMNNALAYGNSTKSFDNVAVGGFGIGLKAVFSLSDSFTVTTTKDGVTCVAIAILVDGLPQQKLLSKTNTGDRSGTVIRLSVPTESMDAVCGAARKSFIHWSHPIIIDDELQSPQLLAFTDTVKVVPHESSGYSYRTHLTHVEVGGFILSVPYSLQQELLDLSNPYQQLVGRVDIIAQVAVGDLEIAPSRERIENTPSNLATLSKLLTENTDTYKENLKVISDKVSEFYDEIFEMTSKTTYPEFFEFCKSFAEYAASPSASRMIELAARQHLSNHIQHFTRIIDETFYEALQHIGTPSQQTRHVKRLKSAFESLLKHIPEHNTPLWAEEFLANAKHSDYAYRHRRVLNRNSKYVSQESAYHFDMPCSISNHGNYLLDLTTVGTEVETKKLAARMTRLYNAAEDDLKARLVDGTEVDLDPSEVVEIRSSNSTPFVEALRYFADFFQFPLQELDLESIFELNKAKPVQKSAPVRRTSTAPAPIQDVDTSCYVLKDMRTDKSTKATLWDSELNFKNVGFYATLEKSLNDPSVQLYVYTGTSEHDDNRALSVLNKIRFEADLGDNSIVVLRAPTDRQLESIRATKIAEKANKPIEILSCRTLTEKYLTATTSRLIYAIHLVKGFTVWPYLSKSKSQIQQLLPEDLKTQLEAKSEIWLHQALQATPTRCITAPYSLACEFHEKEFSSWRTDHLTLPLPVQKLLHIYKMDVMTSETSVAREHKELTPEQVKNAVPMNTYALLGITQETIMSHIHQAVTEILALLENTTNPEEDANV